MNNTHASTHRHYRLEIEQVHGGVHGVLSGVFDNKAHIFRWAIIVVMAVR